MMKGGSLTHYLAFPSNLLLHAAQDSIKEAGNSFRAGDFASLNKLP